MNRKNQTETVNHEQIRYRKSMIFTFSRIVRKIQTSLLIQVQQLQVGINRIRNSAPRNFQRQPRFNKMKFYAASQDYVELRRCAELHIKARQFMMQIQAANIINKLIYEIMLFPAATENEQYFTLTGKVTH